MVVGLLWLLDITEYMFHLHKCSEAMFFLVFQFSQGFMVVGIDSYHNAGRKGGSVGAFIASTNKSCSQFYSKVVFQHNHGELVDGLRTCMQCKCLIKVPT